MSRFALRCRPAPVLSVAMLLVAAGLLQPSVSRAHSIGTAFSSPVDGDTAALFWNPAAMSRSPSSRFDLVLNLVVPTITYQRPGIDPQSGVAFPEVGVTTVRPEPFLGLMIDRLWKKRLRIGLAVSVPSAGGASWPETVKLADGREVMGPTRYYATNAQLFYVYTHLGASIRLHRMLSIGLALHLVYGKISADKHIDIANQDAVSSIIPCAQNPLGCENPDASARMTMSGGGLGVLASIGVLFTPLERLRFGVSYMTPGSVSMSMNLGIEADKIDAFVQRFVPQFTSIATSGKGSLTFRLPQRFNFAVSGDLIRGLELAGGFRWANHARTEIVSGGISQRGSALLPESLLILQGRQDEWVVWLRLAGLVRERWRLALLGEWGTTVVPDAYVTPASLDFDWLSVSLAARVLLPRRVGLGLIVSEIFLWNRDIKVSAFGNDRLAPFNTPDPTGRYNANAVRVGLDIDAQF